MRGAKSSKLAFDAGPARATSTILSTFAPPRFDPSCDRDVGHKPRLVRLRQGQRKTKPRRRVQRTAATGFGAKHER
jgi:hypothetical protein